MLSVPLGLLGSCGTLLGQLLFFDLQYIKFWDPFVSAISRQLLQMVPKVLIPWRDGCNDRGLHATWLSQSSCNLTCSLIRFKRQSGSINQAVHPATAATFMSNCDQWSFQFVMGIDTSAKEKKNPTTHHAPLGPAVSSGLSILQPSSGTTLNPQRTPPSHPKTASYTDHGTRFTSAPLQNVFIWDSLCLSLSIASSPPPLNALLVYSLKFNRSYILHNKVIYIQWFQKSNQTVYDVEYLCCGDKL